MKWSEHETMKLVSVYNDYEYVLIIKKLGKIKKCEKSGAGVNDVYVPNIKLFCLMDCFMKNDGESTLESDEGPDHTVDKNTEYSANTSSRDQAQSSALSQSVSRVTSNTRGRKRQLDDLRSAVNGLKHVHNNLYNQPEYQVSENKAFGQYITVCLNKLPVQGSVMLQSEIRTLVTKYRLTAVQTSMAVNTPSQTPSQALTSDSESVEEQVGFMRAFTHKNLKRNNILHSMNYYRLQQHLVLLHLNLRTRNILSINYNFPRKAVEREN
nr:unnamed protein product [Callosobruchus analis]